LSARQASDGSIQWNLKALHPGLDGRSIPTRIQLPPEAKCLGDGEAPVQGPVLSNKSDMGEDLEGMSPRRPAKYFDLTRRWREQPDCQVHQRGLAGAVRSNKRNDATWRDAKAAVAQRPHVSIVLGQPGR
jgi:hypothetical protein